MHEAGKLNVHRNCALMGIALAVAACGALLGGCRGNTTAAATVDHRVGAPPEIAALRAEADLTAVDPLAASGWQLAAWYPLQAPANTSHMAPPSRVAIYFDAGKLYVAVIAQSPATTFDTHDAISLYLDPLGQGREVMQITADAAGKMQCTWIRSGTPVQPQADGSPNIASPLDIRPDFQLSGMTCQVRQGMDGDHGAWSVAIALPVASLPAVMRAPLGQGEWRINVLRTLTVDGSAGQHEQMQSNLSPVYLNAQAFSPYRMAHLKFPESTAAAQASN